MIFPSLEIESTLQANDKTRLDARKSFVASVDEPITAISIIPEVGADPVDITENQYLDWAYESAGEKSISLTVSTASGSKGITKTISVLTAEDDALFSGDADLVAHEDGILQFVREGKSSFLDKHRVAQRLIIDHLDELKLWDEDDNRLTKDALIKPEDLKSWSTYLTLAIILEGISNATDDVFSVKASKYRAMANQRAGRATVRLDTDGDGEEDKRKGLTSSFLVRR